MLDAVEKEHAWLPRLAPLLPLPVPVPLAMGAPGHGYPWHWSVYRWLEGEDAAAGRIADLGVFATTSAPGSRKFPRWKMELMRASSISTITSVVGGVRAFSDRRTSVNC